MIEDEFHRSRVKADWPDVSLTMSLRLKLTEAERKLRSREDSPRLSWKPRKRSR